MMGILGNGGIQRKSTPSVIYQNRSSSKPVGWNEVLILAAKYIAARESLSKPLRAALEKAYIYGQTDADLQKTLTPSQRQELQRWQDNLPRKQFIDALRAYFVQSYDGSSTSASVPHWFYQR